MKKAVLISLIFIYSLATMGFTLKQFYCCGKLKSITISLTQNGEKKCGKGNEKNGCCDNKYQFFKVKDNHITADQVSSPVNHFIDLHFYTTPFHNSNFVSQKTAIAYRSNAPPLDKSIPIYIYNCVFRI